MLNKRAETDGTRYLMWKDTVIGKISGSDEVTFLKPDLNPLVKMYTKGQAFWSREEFTEFLSERIVSRDRRDIEKILFRCGLSCYDVQAIGRITRGMHPKDMLWIADSADQTMDSAMTDVFSSVFLQGLDVTGDSLDTPEGYNIKRYGVYEGFYGIYKQRISPLVTDVESERAVYLLARRIGVPCCPIWQTDKDTVFSVFLYDFSKEYIVHFRRLFSGARGENEYQNLLSVRPQYKDDITRMLLLDFIARQDDRHLSNIAIKMSPSGESFYPLYDNGRSLFYEDTEETVQRAVRDVERYATTFGYTGTYWDHIQEAAKDSQLNTLIDLSVTKDELVQILKEAGFSGYRFDGALEWMTEALKMVGDL